MFEKNLPDIYLPHEAEILERIQESPTIVTFRLRFTDSHVQHHFQFLPGQFNMLYLFGVGEVAISISSDPEDKSAFQHTIRSVGRVTHAIANLKPGNTIGVRGPYGNGWPLSEALEKNVVIVTGGLGCAPVVGVIHYLMKRRDQFGHVKILQGLKHSEDFIYRQQYAKWKEVPNTEVYIAADQVGPKWPWLTGRVTAMIQQLMFDGANSIAMMCGPQPMMESAAQELIKKGIDEKDIYLSMERNMECAVGHCGHCQYGGLFICKDGPIFPYTQIKALINEPGF